MIRKLPALMLLLICIPQSLLALEGVVSTENNAAVSRALVVLNIGGDEYRTWTGDRGGFVFQNLPDNTPYELQVSKPAHGSASHIGNTSSSATLNLLLTPDIKILSGKVVTSTGEAISGVTIDGGKIGSTTSAEDGTFSFSVPYGSTYKLIASLEDYYFGNSPSGVLRGDTARIIVGDFD